MADVAPIRDDGTQPPTAESLQFDQAEYQQPIEPMVCAGCKQPIAHAYYALNGVLFCDTCQQAVKASLVGGSKVRRLLRAVLFGIGAAIAGFALYYGVLALTGMEIGLISIVVGLMVGAAVRKGAEYRGGWAYQTLAILLTYSAIAASYSVLAIPQIMAIAKERAEENAEAPAANNAPLKDAVPKDAQPKDAAKKDAERNEEASNAAASNEAAAEDPPASEVAEAVAAAKPNPAEPDKDEELPPVSHAEFAVALLTVGGILFALPILSGFDQPIGLLIVAFALYEAWKLNRRLSLQFTGPHPVGQPNVTAGAAANG